MSTDTNPDSKLDFPGGLIRISAGTTRRATGTIKPAPGSVIRMGSGRKRNLTRGSQHLFVGTIKTQDVWPLPLSGQWPGAELDIDYPGELVEPIGMPQQRPAVPGTLVFRDRFKNPVPEADAVERTYRPRLHIVVMSWAQDDDDWGASATSSLDWEEQPALEVAP